MNTTSTYQLKTGSGRIHTFVEGVTYNVRGSRNTNSATSVLGKAVCGSITSTAASFTDEASNCDKCKGA